MNNIDVSVCVASKVHQTEAHTVHACICMCKYIFFIVKLFFRPLGAMCDS
jgi:hypothetical protein